MAKWLGQINWNHFFEAVLPAVTVVAIVEFVRWAIKYRKLKKRKKREIFRLSEEFNEQERRLREKFDEKRRKTREDMNRRGVLESSITQDAMAKLEREQSHAIRVLQREYERKVEKVQHGEFD